MNRNLEMLTNHHAGVLTLKSGVTTNYGVIENNGEVLVFYTGKGLREIWPMNPTSEELDKAKELRKCDPAALIPTGHVEVVALSEIDVVLF